MSKKSTQEETKHKSVVNSLSRRATLTGLAGLGLLSSMNTAQAGSGDHLGEAWKGAPGTGYGLKINLEEPGFALWGVAGTNSNENNDVGVAGETHSTKGIALSGHAKATSGETRGLQGRVDSPNGTAVFARATASGTGDSKAVRGRNKADGGVGIQGEAIGKGTTYGLKGMVDSSSGYGVYTPDNAKIDGTLEIGGDVQVDGVKNFVQTVKTDKGPKQVKYTSVEAGKPQTETSDVAVMEDGVALIKLPDHFELVTSCKEPLTVQVTPYSEEKVHPQVTDQSTDRIVVKDFGDGPDEYTFAYTVKGIRRGYENQEVLSDSW